MAAVVHEDIVDDDHSDVDDWEERLFEESDDNKKIDKSIKCAAASTTAAHADDSDVCDDWEVQLDAPDSDDDITRAKRTDKAAHSKHHDKLSDTVADKLKQQKLVEDAESGLMDDMFAGVERPDGSIVKESAKSKPQKADRVDRSTGGGKRRNKAFDPLHQFNFDSSQDLIKLANNLISSLMATSNVSISEFVINLTSSTSSKLEVKNLQNLVKRLRELQKQVSEREKKENDSPHEADPQTDAVKVPRVLGTTLSTSLSGFDFSTFKGLNEVQSTLQRKLQESKLSSESIYKFLSLVTTGVIDKFDSESLDKLIRTASDIRTTRSSQTNLNQQSKKKPNDMKRMVCDYNDEFNLMYGALDEDSEEEEEDDGDADYYNY